MEDGRTMRKSKTLTIDDQEIICNELSAEEIQKILDGLDDLQIGIIDMLFPDRIPSSAVKVSTGKIDEELNGYTPSELETIIDAVEEVNPTLADLLQRLAQVGRNYMEMKSEKPAAD